ncbi:hypothetical protein AOA12_04555 [Microbacterium sp. No. 7]|nr:hypothetical protein AOA12_04555 [Microbacterium sp. No. 7]
MTRWLVGHTRRLLPPLVLATLARIVGHLLGVAVIVLAALSLVRIAAGDDVPVAGLVAAIVAMSLVKALLRYLEHYAGHWVAFTALQRLRELLFARLVPQAPAATTGRASAELTERATRDIDRIEVFFAHTFPPVVASVVVPAVALTWFAIVIDAGLAAIVAAFLAVALALPFLGARTAWAAARSAAAARGRLATHVADDVQGLREVLAFTAEDARRAGLERLGDEVARGSARVGRTVAVRLLLERMLWGGCLVALLLSGAAPGDVVAAVALLVALWLGGVSTDDFATGLDAAFSACERVQRIVEAAPLVRDEGRARLADGILSVELDDVTFRYPDRDEPALSHVSVRFDGGGWHRVAGVSGSGKSTLASLLVRGWDPDGGRILLGGTDLPALPLDAVRGAVAVVDQRPVLFTGTVASNLRLARPEADDEELRAALHAVGLDDALADGLRTTVGERGTTLSGGQLQRLALARALVARSRVLVLDEALSQLDAGTAQTVRERLEHAASGTTVIEITHRTDVIPDDATVTVVDRGEVVEHGAAGALRTGGGPFARLSLRA